MARFRPSKGWWLDVLLFLIGAPASSVVRWRDSGDLVWGFLASWLFANSTTTVKPESFPNTGTLIEISPESPPGKTIAIVFLFGWGGLLKSWPWSLASGGWHLVKGLATMPKWHCQTLLTGASPRDHKMKRHIKGRNRKGGGQQTKDEEKTRTWKKTNFKKECEDKDSKRQRRRERGYGGGDYKEKKSEKWEWVDEQEKEEELEEEKAPHWGRIFLHGQKLFLFIENKLPSTPNNPICLHHGGCIMNPSFCRCD